MAVLLLLRRSVNQTWVCRRILRLEFLHRFKVRRIGDDFGELLQLLQLNQFRLRFLLFSNRGAHDFILRFSENVRLDQKIDNDKSVAAVWSRRTTDRAEPRSGFAISSG